MTIVEYDVVVIGSGAAGMTAALTAARHGLSVVVLEKADRFGGSTARSGGGIWIPRADDEQATLYLSHVAPDVAPARREAFVRHAAAMLALVKSATPLRFQWVRGYPDYYPELPGGLVLGRTFEPVPLDGRRVLGESLGELAPPYIPTHGLTVTAKDYKWLSLGVRHPRSAYVAGKLAARAAVAKALGQRMLGMGQALAAGLRAGLRALDVPVLLGTPLESLADGVVNGRFKARRGVLLASGGFEHSLAMRTEYQKVGTDWTVAAASNTGDGIRAGVAKGAAVELMDEAWWGPTVPLPGRPYFCLAERSLPGSIIVDAAGQRFGNESAPYIDAVHAQLEREAVPSWLVFDQRYRNRYLFAGLAPRQPFPRRWYQSGVLVRGQTLDDLGLPGLAKTVARFNEFAASGVDSDFGRGESAYDRYYGDPRTRPNPCLGPIAKPPFYAFKIVPGDLGTKGGLVTDERARVLRPDGTPIAGLYAAGNASAAVMGRSYAGAGATIAPAMTFGYLAVLDMLGE
ncbi:FAD-dependent oxidoreductase [Allorhizocola rhizosphaerae]|uniref:FAD-dependent oxidoreductase n=1 Tax=Allorhizocola rhizosphaerae TaxID=1872709 RepID=UPI0024822C89|nr:FAD-dependent oxidoreductase [Allorhizocola rhizosphaerae]